LRVLVFLTTPSSRINAQFASCGLFLTCIGKRNF
jgi:hypothetical protein